jgi:DNA polymerase I-like protein with 3'-5' exonuclease and polymerase domains
MRVVLDIETTGFIDHTSIDYTASPYKLFDTFKVHCIAVKDIDTGKMYTFAEEECYTEFLEFSKQFTMLVGHNIINFDLLVLKVALGLNYTIGDIDTFDERPVEIWDTMIASKVLNPDRYGGHSIEAWGKTLGLEKIDWRAKAIEVGLISKDAPAGAEFAKYSPEMLEYNIRDVEVNHKVYNALVKEWGDWPWQDAFKLEQKVAEIITRQQHRGFWFDKDFAEECVRDLDSKMEEIRNIVEPLIPPRTLAKTKQAFYTPGKEQFLKSGQPNVNIGKFVAKHGSKLEERDGNWYTVLYGKEYKLPLPCEPLITTEPGKLSSSANDSSHIKGWLMQEYNWNPTQYKERDLTVDSKKKKISQERFEIVVEKYAEQTLNSPFRDDRCYELEVKPNRLRDKLLKHDIKRPLKVYTNPTLTVGQEKEIDPNLLAIGDKFPHAKLVSDYFTYTHRRNSILGGGVDPDDDEEENEVGFLSEPRLNLDHRIPTPAGTCDAATSRMKHRKVANISRTSSLYGKQMRSLFGADLKDGFLQLAFDFDSLEAKMETHAVFRYPGGPEYGVSLTAEKPNDCHSVLARSITKMLNREFPRQSAKPVKYGCSYNAQAKRVAKTVGCSLEDGQIIFNAFWIQAAPLKLLKEAMQKYWETTGQKKFIPAIDKRKLPIRSKGNVINSYLQSAGVICAKRAMVMHDAMLEEEGLLVDFFTEDWKSKNFCQQMIAYHDEAQYEVRRSAVEFKTFPVKGALEITDKEGKLVESEEAKAAKKAAKEFKEAQTDRVWSDVMHTDKMYYVAYNRSGELAVRAVKMSGEYYKLNVELTAGYMIGTNWATCH